MVNSRLWSMRETHTSLEWDQNGVTISSDNQVLVKLYIAPLTAKTLTHHAQLCLGPQTDNHSFSEAQNQGQFLDCKEAEGW
jgi:hypothetical protein